jgi:hypothetical protein
MAASSKMIVTRTRKKIVAKMSAAEMFLALTRATIPKPMVASAAPMVAGVALGSGDSGVKIAA